MSQKQMILRHLKEYPGIDPMTAWEKYGIYRLGARIFDLRADGYNIVTNKKQVPNRYGDMCEVAEYRFIE